MRHLLLLIALICTSVAAGARVVEAQDTLTARTAFEDLPSQYLELLPRSTRLDMLDYFEADSVYRATNVLQGKSWIEQLTPTYIRVRITDVSTLQLKVLPGKRQIVAMSYTISGPASDSELRFFDSRMQPLPTDKVMRLPRLADFIDRQRLKQAGISQSELQQMIPFPAVVYTLSPDSDTLTATLRIDDLMGQESAARLSPALKQHLIYRWTPPRYTPSK